MLQNIPAELRRLKQWVVASGVIGPDGKPNKEPLNPRTGRNADVTDPTTWGTFEEASASSHKLVGFVLSRDDPYAAIDLDDPADKPLTEAQAKRHSDIFDYCKSYAETSLSGRGVHLLVRGGIPHGMKKDKVEVYSQDRYMICTGNVIQQMPITDQQELLDILFKEMSRTTAGSLIDLPEVADDAEIMRIASSATNGAKFDSLCTGDWQGYPSQSEADLALMSIIGYYSKSNEQCRRLFRMSGLGQREKAQRNRYLNYMLEIIRGKEGPQIDWDEFFLNLKTNDEKTKRKPAAPPVGPTEKKGLAPPFVELGSTTPGKSNSPFASVIAFPPGLIGDVAEYIFSSAIRPVREVALAGALAFVAGICGRSYNISSTGLNQYVILLADTGRGKEALAKGINALIRQMRQQAPAADQFIGPSTFASGQGLIKVLDTRPCFMSLLNEFGYTLQDWCDPRAATPVKMIKKVVLDLYAKSGFDDLLYPMAYSDTDKNTKTVRAPCVTILGEGTAESFYNGLDASHIAGGLIPRFCVIEYDGPRPRKNKRAFEPASQELIDKLVSLAGIAMATQQNNTFQPVAITAEAQQMLTEFDEYVDDLINGAQNSLEVELWNRADLKCLKFSGLLAVGMNPLNPVVTAEGVTWARDFVYNGTVALVAKFGSGDMGSGAGKQEHDIMRAVKGYLSMSGTARKSYKVPVALLSEPLVPYHFLRRRLRLVASFRDDRQGFNLSLDRMLDAMVKAEQLILIDARVAQERFKVNSPLYAKGPHF